MGDTFEPFQFWIYRNWKISSNLSKVRLVLNATFVLPQDFPATKCILRSNILQGDGAWRNTAL